MSELANEERVFYAAYGTITDPGQFAGFFEGLPSDIGDLCRVVHGLVLHPFWAERYGEKVSEARGAEVSLRHVSKIVARLQEIKAAPLTDDRNLGNRLVGNCRTFSTLLAAMLQSQEVPARARCGFRRYFTPGWHEDHWVCEYWNDEQKRWIMVDAQLDAFQRQALKIAFDPLEVPREQFVVAGKAWQRCRTGEADPNKFGIFDMHGLWFIRGNLVRDVAALNKVELLPWDGWGLADCTDEKLKAKQLALLDDVALSTYDEVDFDRVRLQYEANGGVKVSQVIKSYTPSGTIEVDLASEDVLAI